VITEIVLFKLDDKELREVILKELFPITESFVDRNNMREQLIDYIIKTINYYLETVSNNNYIIAKREN